MSVGIVCRPLKWFLFALLFLFFSVFVIYDLLLASMSAGGGDGGGGDGC